MRLPEYLAKELISEMNINVPKGHVVESHQDAVELTAKIKLPFVIKAQILLDNREKHGGVILAKTPEEVLKVSNDMLDSLVGDRPVKKVLVEEYIKAKKELFLSFYIDKRINKNILLFSVKGGVNVESQVKNNPDSCVRISIDSDIGITEQNIQQIGSVLESDSTLLKELSAFISNAYEFYIKYDLVFLEINPLVQDKKGELFAIDIKMVVDDNALFRQKRIREMKFDNDLGVIEGKAKAIGLRYVGLDGDIGIITNGASLCMATMDEILECGGKPANFLDLGTGASEGEVKAALGLLLVDSAIKGLFINIFGSITRCDEVARGIISATNEMNIPMPIIVRLEGTNSKEGYTILENSPLLPATSVRDGAEKIVEIVGVVD
jgi:succinyl-CoA synthetase beta subunit